MKETPVEVKHHVQHRYPAASRFCPLCGAQLLARPVAPDNRPRKVCSACGFVEFLSPKLVAACLLVRDSKVLLLRRGIEPARGKWTFPGGYVDLGETAVEAAARETVEEVGVCVKVGRLLGLYFDPAQPQAAVTVYFAEAPDSVPSLSEEALEVRYFGADEIPWEQIAFPTTADALRDWIETVKQG